MLIVDNKYRSLHKIFESKNIKLATEGTLKGGTVDSDYSKHDYKYAIAVIDMLLSGSKLPLGGEGADGEAPTTELTDSVKAELQNLKENIQSSTEKDFNRIIKNFGFTWSKIYKSDEIKGSSKDSLSEKQLTPQDLGISGTFLKSEFLPKIEDALMKSSKISEELADSLIYICKQIDSKTDDDAIDLDSMIRDGAKKVLKYNIKDSKVSLEALNNSMAAITKDFGEIIGGLFLLNYIENASAVNYSDSYTVPMIDYEIIMSDKTKMGVSAKIANGGHAPSSAEIFKALKQFVISPDVTVNGMTFDQFIESKFVTPVNKTKVKKFINLMLQTSEKSTSTKEQYVILIDTFASDNAVTKEFCKLFGFSRFSDLISVCGIKPLEKNFSSMFDEVCDKSFKKLSSLCSSIKQKCGFASTTTFKTAEEAKKLSSSQKIGLFIYPLSQFSIKKINNDFGLLQEDGKTIDIISAFAQLAFTHKQIYTKIAISSDADITITFSFAAMDKGNWVFKCPTSSNEPFVQKVALKLH